MLALGAGSIAWTQYRSAEGAQRLAAVVADPAATRVTGRPAGGGQVALIRTEGDVVAISVEPAGGSSAPTTMPVVALTAI